MTPNKQIEENATKKILKTCAGDPIAVTMIVILKKALQESYEAGQNAKGSSYRVGYENGFKEGQKEQLK